MFIPVVLNHHDETEESYLGQNETRHYQDTFSLLKLCVSGGEEDECERRRAAWGGQDRLNPGGKYP